MHSGYDVVLLLWPLMQAMSRVSDGPSSPTAAGGGGGGGDLDRTLMRQVSASDTDGPQTPDVFVRRTAGLLRAQSSGGGDGGGAGDVSANAAIDAEAAAVANEPLHDFEEEPETECCGGCPFFSAARLTLFVAFSGLVFLLTVGAIAYIAYSTSHFLADCVLLLAGVATLGGCRIVVWSSCMALTCRAYTSRRRKQQANEDADWYGAAAAGGPLSARNATAPGGSGGGRYRSLAPNSTRSGGAAGGATAPAAGAARPSSPGPVAADGGAAAATAPAGAGGSKPAAKAAQCCACLRCCGRDRWPRLACSIFAAVTILATFFVFGALVALKVSTLPGYDGTLVLPGMTGATPTYVTRESNGMIHIVAPNEHDMYFAQGVACAQERLWQMEFQRRVGSGRLSAAVGAVDTALRIDQLMRTVNFYGAAQAAWTSLDAATQSALQAYCDGINRYLDTSPPIPLEFDLLGLSHRLDYWVPADLLVWTKLMSWQLSGNMDKELWRWDLLTKLNVSAARIAELDPPFDTAHFPVVLDPVAELQLPPDTDADAQANAKAEGEGVDEPIFEWLEQWRERQRARAPTNPQATTPSSASTSYLRESIAAYRSIFGTAQASNNWVIHGNRTASGKPLLCNDPHLGLTAASVWILFDLRATDTGYSAIGSSFVGTPGIVLGHNRDIAWGVTNTGADCQDLYVMIEPDTGSSSDSGAQGQQYWYDGAWRNYTWRSEVIEVKGGESRTLLVRDSVYGPVVTDIQAAKDDPDLRSPPLALHWTSLLPTDSTFSAFLGVAHATNYSSFRAALAPYVAPAQNFVFADTQGNIGYQLPGAVPTRVKGHTGMYPVPGNGTFDWTGFVPFDALPHVYNPAKGFVVSANNRVTTPAYNYTITRDWDSGSDGYRAKRITQMILSKPKLSFADMQSVQNDYYSLLCHDFQPLIARLTPHTDDGRDWQRALLAWNCDTSPGTDDRAQAATLFAHWYSRVSTLAAAEVNATHYDNSVYLMRALNATADTPADRNCLLHHTARSRTSAVTAPARCLTCGKGSGARGLFAAAAPAPAPAAPVAAAAAVAAAADPSAPTACLSWASQELDSVSGDVGSAESVTGWGSGIHHAYMQHPVLSGSPVGCISDRSVGHGGDASTVNVGSYQMNGDDDHHSFTQTAGPSYRQVIDLSDLDGSAFVLPLGLSGNLLSELYDNWLPLWANAQYIAMSQRHDAAYTLTLTSDEP